jgi:hypothetical protein
MKFRRGEMKIVKDFYLKIGEGETNPKLVEHGGIRHKESSTSNSGIGTNPLIISWDL